MPKTAMPWVRLEAGTTLTLGQDEQGRSLYDVISGQIRSAIHCATGESPCALQRAFRSRTGMADATAAVRGTELASVVQGCGLVVPPGDAVAFAHAVRALASDRAQREQLGAAGYLYAQEHLDRQAVLQKFEADVLAMISNGR